MTLPGTPMPETVADQVSHSQEHCDTLLENGRGSCSWAASRSGDGAGERQNLRPLKRIIHDQYAERKYQPAENPITVMQHFKA